MVATPEPSACDNDQPRWPRVCGVGCALAAVVLLAWQSALEGDFHFDDYGAIVENRAIRSLWPLDDFATVGRPAGLYSFALNYHFSQLDPAAYRLTNLLIHTANVALLFAGVLLTSKIIQRRVSPAERPASGGLLLSAMVALLWGLHPLTTQAVTNIVQRYESMSALGYLGAWVGMLLVIRGTPLGLPIILISAWVGLLSKEVFATAPLVILLFDRCVTGQSWRAIFKTRWLAYFLVMSPFVWFVPSVLRWFDPSRSTSMGFGLKSVSSWEYLRTQPEIILHYLRLSCWPDPLCFDYAWRVQQNPIIYLSLGLVILLLLIAGLWLYVTGLGESDGEATPSQSTAKGIAGWLILTFFLMLAPTSSFMPIADLCVEHRMYLPLAVVVSGVCLFANRVRIALEARSQHPGVVTAGMMLGLLACLTLLAWRTDLRNREYRDGIALWKSVLSVRPENPRAWFMLGSEYFGRDRFEEALPLYEKAVSFQMPIGEFYARLADCLRELGQPDAAVENYQRAIELKPSLAKAHNGLGVIRQREGNLEAAQGAFQQAHDLGLPEARYNLANVLIEQGEFAAAVPLLEESLAEHPDFFLAARRLAWILATAPQQDLRDGQSARELLDRHYRVNESDSPFVWDTHAAILAEQRQFDEAVSAAQHALALATEREDPDLAAAIQKRLEGYRQQRPWREEVRP